MRVGILQPGYLPWLGFFEQIYRSDVFVIYDDVQYDKQGWRNRNRIKTAGGAVWLTVPVTVKFNDHPLIDVVKIDNKHNWRKKHLLSIKQNYSNAPFYEKYVDIFEEAYSSAWEYLVDIDIFFIIRLAAFLGIDTKKIIRSSVLKVEGNTMERLVRICREVGADVFYEGSAGKNYIDEDYFMKSGIKIEYQEYSHPVYEQRYGEFIPYLSVIDLLFNHGPQSLSILTGQTVVEKSGVRTGHYVTD